MIVLASDYVGYRVVDFLVRRGEPIKVLGLDSRNPGGYNEQIRRAFEGAGENAGVVVDADCFNDPAFLDELSKGSPELGILAWWPKILKGRILELPARGWLNFHPSYLPFNRGKHPNFWCLVDETPCGVSLHFIDRCIDTGDVVARALVEVNWEDTGETVYRRSLERIVSLFEEHFDDISAGRAPRIPQNMEEGSFHWGRELDPASRIDLDEQYPARKLLNILRARTFEGHPSAYFEADGKRYAVRVSIREVRDQI
jgi:methionyl-tRNA formyltransferase